MFKRLDLAGCVNWPGEPVGHWTTRILLNSLAGHCEEAGVTVSDQPNRDWALLLRRLDGASDGRPEDGRADEYELICSDCGDDPRRGYHEVPAGLQQVRGPYPLIAGIEAFTEHSEPHRTIAEAPARS